MPNKLGEVFRTLRRVFPTLSQPVKPLRVPAQIQKQIFDEFMTIFVGSEMPEVREGASGAGAC
jgi:hypothetical protein